MPETGVASPWVGFWSGLSEIARKLSTSRAAEVRSTAVQSETSSLVQAYFRDTRPYLSRIGIADSELQSVDAPLQELLRLSYRRNPVRAYREQLRLLEEQRAGLEIRVASKEGMLGARPSPRILLTRKEKLIIETLGALIPTAARSYEQALLDLADETRQSYRGTASELRETLREVVDRLAPERQVEAEPDYRPERDLTHPTLKQKVRFVLRSRGGNDAELRGARDTADLVELAMGSLARSIYDRGSIMAHVNATRHDVQMLKNYVDLLLGELLQITD